MARPLPGGGRLGYQHPGVVPPTTTQPNDLSTAHSYPLTIADQQTRYLLACHGLLSTKGHGVRPVFEWLFRQYGLPRAIRTDNGVPFAATGIDGLSQLNGWWLRLGIQHQRILPAQPQQNGAHERMHKTLKGEAIRPPRATLASQQRAFNAFRRLHNTERPHEALNDHPPASRYCPSPRSYTGTCPPSSILGTSSSSASPTPAPSAFWSIHFCHVLLGRVDERDYIIRA